MFGGKATIIHVVQLVRHLVHSMQGVHEQHTNESDDAFEEYLEFFGVEWDVY